MKRILRSVVVRLSAAILACAACGDGEGEVVPAAGQDPARPADAPNSGPADRPAPTAVEPSKPLPTAGTFTVVTYNVAGLPEALTSSKAATTTPLMSPKLNPFDLVLVQEDFAYHKQLTSASTFPHVSTPMQPPTPTDLGDGLNILSRFPFSGEARTKWKKCSGIFDQKNDCLTSKGFFRVVFDLGQGRMIDVYNVHFDAGRSKGDAAAREEQVTQLTQAIAANSADRAIIVAGDTNMKVDDEPTFQRLLDGADLTCACRAIKCAEPNRIDRVLFRSTASVKLSAKSLEVLDFVDGAGKPLSDHEPVRVELALEQ